MSGIDERPYKVPNFPRCASCNHAVWTKGYEGFEYINIGNDPDVGGIYQWSDDEYTYTGTTTPWRCNNCGRNASIDQVPVIDEFARTVEWIN